MKSVRQLLVGLACVALLCVSWVIAVSSKSSERKQTELIDKALILMNDGIYVRAVPLLEEAAGLQTKLTRTAEETLKKAYLQLLGTYGYSKKYTNLLETQMRRDDADADIFLEAADFWLRTSKIQQALSVLKKGIERTGDADLKSL